MLATELLMPRNVFLERAGSDPGIDSIFERAQVFQTSLSATAIRCAELLRLSVFQVQNGSVAWGYGAIKEGPDRMALMII